MFQRNIIETFKAVCFSIQSCIIEDLVPVGIGLLMELKKTNNNWIDCCLLKNFMQQNERLKYTNPKNVHASNEKNGFFGARHSRQHILDSEAT